MAEPIYSRQTFKRILETFGEDIAKYYEIRDDGAWLIEQPSIGVDEVAAWTPACALESYPNGPDPLDTPAIPFPFTAKQLTAWMLAGWGSMVPSAVGPWAVDPAPEVLGMLGVNGAKAREVLIAAYREYQAATAIVGSEPVEEWATAQVARERHGLAWDAARERHGLLDSDGEIPQNLSKQEYSARLKLAHADVVVETQEMREAQSVSRQLEAQWLSRMVHRLTLSEDEAKAESLTAEADFRDGFATVVEGQGLDADRWARLPLIEAKQAAMLICGINPAVYPDPAQIAPSGADLPRFRLTLAAFESNGRDGVSRSLYDWMAVASGLDLPIDPRVLAVLTTSGTPKKIPRRDEVQAKSRTQPQPLIEGRSATSKARILAAYRGGARNVSALERETGVPRRTINRVLVDAGLKHNKK